MRYLSQISQTFQFLCWPTSGFVLGLLLRSDRKHWAIIIFAAVVGAMCSQTLAHLPISARTSNAVATLISEFFCASCLPQCKKLDEWLQEPHLLALYVAFPLTSVPLFDAFIVASIRYYAGVLFPSQPHIQFWQFIHYRAISEMLSFAMVTTLVLVISTSWSRNPFRLSEIYKPAISLLTVAVTAWIILNQSSYSLIFILGTVVVLVCLQQGFRTSVLAINILSIMATSAAFRNQGIFSLGGGVDVPTRIILLQGYLALQMVSVFAISITLLQRDNYHAKLNQANTDLQKLATIDEVTGIANRRSFEDTLKAEWARALRTQEPLAVLLMDIDNFKEYNDRFGHPAGDYYLFTIAQSIATMEHRSTDLLARYGGEEFVLLLPATTLEGASQIAELVRSRVELLPSNSGNARLGSVTISIGCAALVPNSSISSTQLISAADQALYRAKRNGRNRVELHDEILISLRSI